MHKPIDIHGHFGNPERFPQSNQEKEMYRISLESLKKNYVQQGITAACISPMEGIFPDNTDALLDANRYMEELAEEQDWIYQWVIVNPLMPASFHQAEKILKNRKCVGVKIHPDAHVTPSKPMEKKCLLFVTRTILCYCPIAEKRSVCRNNLSLLQICIQRFQ